MFNALVVNKDEESGKTSAAVEQISTDQLPEGNVAVNVEYSTVNYKDGLCIGPGGGLVREYPHVPGIDFAGTVESSDDPRYSAGDSVVLTGCAWARCIGADTPKRPASMPIGWFHCQAVCHRVRRWRSAPQVSPRCWRLWRLKIMG